MTTKVTFAVLLSVALISFSFAGGVDQPASGPTPVLVELFTSEGCSTCPPADAFLQKLDEQPFPGTQMVVLSEHVDYWDHLGWRDIYSSHLLTEGQNDYAQHFGLKSAYTPKSLSTARISSLGPIRNPPRRRWTRARRLQRFQ